MWCCLGSSCSCIQLADGLGSLIGPVLNVLWCQPSQCSLSLYTGLILQDVSPSREQLVFLVAWVLCSKRQNQSIKLFKLFFCYFFWQY
jgi:hypothetical protein